jgi:hypothetical protein
VVKRDHLVHDLAQLVQHLPLVVAVAAAVKEAGTRADVALVLVGPGDDLCLACAVFHRIL